MSNKGFWQRVKSLLRQKKLTGEEISKACGISYNTWRGWIAKSIIPGLQDCVKIARCLDVSLDYLATGKERNSQAHIAEIQSLMKKANYKLTLLK